MQIETTTINDELVGILYRPTGQKEYDLVKASAFKEWPPRLPEQPIFYPVTNQKYAEEIASKWNTKDAANGSIGYVTKFHVKQSFLSKYNVETVGGGYHTELWIPAEDVDEMNANIVGEIEVVNRFE